MKTTLQNEQRLVLVKKLTNYYVIGAILLALGLIVGLTSINANQPNLGVVVFITILLVVGGVLTILFGGQKIITFDKSQGTIIVDNQQHIRKSQKTYELSLADSIFQKVKLQSSSNSRQSRPSTPKTIYEYYLNFSNGHTLYLGSVSRSLGANLMSAVGVGNEATPAYVKNIAHFLNIEIKSDSLGQKMAAVGGAGNLASQFLNKK